MGHILLKNRNTFHHYLWRKWWRRRISLSTQSFHLAGNIQLSGLGRTKAERMPSMIFTEPRITSVDMNMYEIGEEAGSILVKNLAHPNLRIQTFTSEPCIFERETT